MRAPLFALLLTPLFASLVAAGPGGASPGYAQGTPAANQATPPPTPPAPTPIPVPEIVAASEEVAALLRRVDRALQPSAPIDDVAADLPAISARIAVRQDDTAEIIAEGGQPRALDRLGGAWQTVRVKLSGWSDALSRKAVDLEELLQEIERLRDLWALTRTEAVVSKAPAALLDRVDATLGELRGAQQRLTRRRAEVLGLQSRVAGDLALVDAALGQIADARLARVGKLFRRDTRPVWQVEGGFGARGEVATRVRDALAFEVAGLWEFVRTDTLAVAVQLLAFLALGALFRRARAQTRAWIEAEPELERRTRVFRAPWSSAFVLAMLGGRVLYPASAQLYAQATTVLAVVPTVRLLRLVAPQAVRPGLWAIAIFFLFDQLRDVVSVLPQLEQVLLLAELLLAIGFLAWLRRGRSSRARELVEATRIPRARVAADLAIAALSVAVGGGALGYVQLARVLGGSVLASVYIGAVLYVGVRAADGLVAYALRAEPLARSRVVDRHRPVVEHRVHRALVWLAVALWSLGLAKSLALDQVLWSAVLGLLAVPLAPGGWEITVGDVLAVGAAIWLAFTLSRFVRFVLDEDVYPRVELPRGVPYAISTLLHYALLLGGFFLALATLGFDMNRFTVLAGAFGVGIGFGLQNVVNNFVSGLILLFERPVQVGDSVQIGELMGEVRRIGIRSSTVRTWQGAEVIVPNGNLISQEVTNWTLSDRMRRIDIPVGVAYGSDPARVLELLRGVARAHPAIVAEPPPVAIFIRFGDSSLDFELRVWTNRFEQAVITRSDLGIAICAALRQEGIEIPYPQRDVHVRSLPPAQEGTRAPDAALRERGPSAGGPPGERSGATPELERVRQAGDTGRGEAES